MTASTAARALRVPLVAGAALALVVGVWSGLARVGWDLPVAASLPGAHGPLMVVGFLGTLVGLERAVALGTPAAWAVPLAALAGAAAVVAGHAAVGAFLASLAAAAATFVAARLWLADHTRHGAVMALAAGAWLAGSVAWAAGAPLFRVVPLWEAFLVLTIVAERLELTRLLRPSRFGRVAFVGAASVYVAGLAAPLLDEAVGARLRGAGALALAAWLIAFDLARRTVRQQGLQRFVAICLLGGYAWLAVSGALVLRFGALAAGPLYDAALHTVFVGFVLAMIFGHAPIVLPAIARLALPFRPRFYVHLALLHAGLALRVAGDLAPHAEARRWGALLNAVALLVFAASTAAAVAGAHGKGRATGRSGPRPHEALSPRKAAARRTDRSTRPLRPRPSPARG